MILRVEIYWQSLPQNGENRKFDVCIAAKATPNIELSRLRSTIKVGVTGCYEKDINLKIVEKLKLFLEMEGIKVLLIRDGDYGLYEETDSNKKNADMRNRVKFIEETQPDLTISIHQNSYSDESIRGAQTFFDSSSEESKKLAQMVQESLH